MFTSDFKEFLSLLNSHQVEYMVVGGYAVGAHGFDRFTGDLDVWIRPSADNSARVVEVINKFGFASYGLTQDTFAVGRRILHMGKRPMQIDVMNAVDGIEFDASYPNRIEAMVDGVRVPFIGLPELRINKRAAGRPKDLDDLAHLPEK